MSNEFERFIDVLSARTALEELLSWDEELADYLVATWALFPIKADSNKELMCALYAAQLPADKKHFSEKLEQWLLDNYNILTR